MKSFIAHDFMTAVRSFGQYEELTSQHEPSTQLSQKTIENLRVKLPVIKETLIYTGFPFSAMVADRGMETFKGSGTFQDLNQWLTEIQNRLIDEMKSRVYLSLEPDEAQLYDQVNPFGEGASRNFPSTAFDIEEAGKCLALSRSTACVFHLMRVLEAGLYALANDLSIENVQENWQNAIDQIQKAIKGLRKGDKRIQHHSEAAAHLMNVKDAWRNRTMHTGLVYTPEKAKQIYDGVKAFMQTLATRLSE